MGRPRREPPKRELAQVERARRRLDKATEELHAAIRAAAEAGSPLRPLAEAAAMSVESARQVIARKP